MRVIFINLGPRRLKLEMPDESTIEDVKAEIYDQEDITSSQMILKSPDGAELTNDIVLSSLKFDLNIGLTVEIKPRPQIEHPSKIIHYQDDPPKKEGFSLWNLFKSKKN
jgi:hypothetical protein